MNDHASGDEAEVTSASLDERLARRWSVWSTAPDGSHGVRRRTNRDVIVSTAIDLSTIAGLSNVSVVQLCSVSEISPRSFYNHFPNIPSAFAEGYGRIDGELRDVIAEAFARHDQLHDCARACVEAIIGFIQRDRLAAEALLVQGFAAGPDVAELRVERMRWLRSLFCGRYPTTSASSLVVEIAIGGISDVIFRYLNAGDVAGLCGQAPYLVETLLRPFDLEVDLAA